MVVQKSLMLTLQESCLTSQYGLLSQAAWLIVCRLMMYGCAASANVGNMELAECTMQVTSISVKVCEGHSLALSKDTVGSTVRPCLLGSVTAGMLALCDIALSRVGQIHLLWSATMPQCASCLRQRGSLPTGKADSEMAAPEGS